MAQLHYPAPRRNSIQSASTGKWYTVPWTKAAIAWAKIGGAWFKTAAQHDFAENSNE